MAEKHTFIDLFSGCGGMSTGFENAGFECVGFVEFWRPAIDSHLHNCGGKLIGEDITTIKDSEIEKYKGTNVIIGGPPCQGFSMAGKREQGDARNRLFEEFVRFVKIIEPDYFVMENVQGIGSMKDIEGELIIKDIFKKFNELGYEVMVKVLVSSNYGVPQNRKRAIFLGAFSGSKINFPAFKSKKFLKEVLDLPYSQDFSIQHIYETNATKNNYKFSYVKQGDVYGSFKSTNKKLKMDGFACTITKSGRYIHPVYNRFLSVRECARIQSFPDSFVFSGSIQDMYGQIGNAVPVKMAQAIAEEVQEALNG